MNANSNHNSQFSVDLLSIVGKVPIYLKALMLSVVFVLFIAPTLVSYAPYSFRWDDADYLWRSIRASQAFWSGNGHDLLSAMVSIRPPVMTLLGLPWGPLASWDDAGKCFITLTGLTALSAACALFLLLRIGVNSFYLVVASICVFAALGPWPAGTYAHFFSSGFMADSLFAWSAFAAVLLIPYETQKTNPSFKSDLVRGVLWGVIFSLGAITKVSFLYFILLIIPTLFVIRMRESGTRSALLSSVSLAACSLPVTIYWLRYGLPALKNGWAASFGHDAPLYHVSFLRFLSSIVQASPGLLLFGVFVVTGIVFMIAKRRLVAWWPNIVPLLITVGFCAISLASSNRQLRYSFVGIIAVPYLIALLISDKSDAFPRSAATTVAMISFCCLLGAGLPMWHRAERQCIAKSETVLAQAVSFNAKRVLLATDSSTLNGDLMHVAIEVSPWLPQIETESLAWNAASGQPIEADFEKISKFDLVVFQNERERDMPLTNQRVSEYERFTKRHFGDVPIKDMDGIRFYKVKKK
jgi:hypothetical protein